MKNFTIFTVEHTGTTFTVTLFNKLEIKKPIWKHVHAKPRPLTTRMKAIYGEHIVPERPLIVTARDPYLCAIRLLNENTLEAVEARWDTFLDIIKNRNHFVVDVGCPEEKRYEHLCEALDFVEVPDYNKDFVKKYAENWAPVNSSKITETKTKYLETRKLPEGYDWKLLDRAVTWYRSLATN